MNPHVFRRQALIDQLPENSLSVLFSGDLVKRSADAAYPFSVNRNFYYLTGLDEDSLILMIVKLPNQVKTTLFIKDYDPVMEKWVGKSIKADVATAISGITAIQTISSFESVLARTLDRNPITTLGIDSERESLKGRPMEGAGFAQRMLSLYPGLGLINLKPKISALRTIKSSDEIEYLRQAIAISREGILALLKGLKPGRMEYEIVADFDHVLGLNHSTNAFETIAASGANACTLHYVQNDQVLNDNELVLLDLGATKAYYCADISRTFPVSGRFSPRQATLYSIVLEAQQAVFDAIKPGVTLLELNTIVKNTYAKRCVEEGVIASADQVDTVYYHSVSHFLGLDTHDVGQLEGMKLVPGMVITVEPGLYVANEGIGIRIEDDVLVTETGMENLSVAIPKTINEIEAMLNQP
jgi:Xaa-Pro aminopeptidase